MCLGNISKHFGVSNVKNRVKRICPWFPADYNTIEIYSMKKHDMFRFIKKIFIALRFSRSLATKCLSLSNQRCQVKSTLIGVNSNEILIIHFLLVLISVMEVAIQLMICMLRYAFQIK